MKLRSLDIPDLINVLIREHGLSRSKLFKIVDHIHARHFHNVVETVNELKTDVSHHVIDEEAIILRKAVNMFGRDGCRDLIEFFQKRRIILI